MTGNKGDWGEFYAFIKTLTDKKIYSADADLNIIPNTSFLVLNILRKDEKNGDIRYDINNSKDELHLTKGLEPVEIIDLNDLRKSVVKIFDEILTSKATTFEVKTAEDLIKKLHCSKIKAKPLDKADLFITVHDGFTPQTPTLGFSVKSQFGNTPTLVNSSNPTNFIYEIKDWQGKRDEISRINGLTPPKGKIQARVTEIKAQGGQLEFYGMLNETFKRNLIKVDSALPEILAEMILLYYSGQGSDLGDLTEQLKKDRYLRRRYDLVEEDFAYKIKQFISAYALGMVASKKWDGLTKAQGGYLIVKKDSSVVCYHLYNKDELQDYLFSNTRLDTGSSTRNNFGQIYEKDDRFFINLNLQISFTK